jgi:cytoskeletal protein CcmA (bactofilin family)
MWGNKKPDTQSTDVTRPVDTAVNRETGWLGSSLHVKGDITGTEDLLIDGSVEGQIQLDERKLTVGATAKLMADINARDVVVYGYVKGNVRARGRIEIKKDGSVVGNLTTAQIMIEDGADFKGSIEIDRSEAKVTDNSVSSKAAAAGAGPKGV